MKRVLKSLAVCMAASASPMASAQDYSITLEWVENAPVQSGVYGTPTALDLYGNFYRAGQKPTAAGIGRDVVLQKFDEEGNELWMVVISNSDKDVYAPSKVVSEKNYIYVTGTVTYDASGQTDVFVSKITDKGNVDWIDVDVATNNDYALDLVVNPSNENIYVCGTSDRNGTFDMLLLGYNGSGTQLYAKTRDYAGFGDGAARITLNNGLLRINGSSQSNNVDWDMVSWYFDEGGSFVNEGRNSATSTSSDEARDGVVTGGILSLTGRSFSLGTSDFKVVCYDANNQVMWQDTYDKAGLMDEGTAITPSTNGFYATGYSTTASGKTDILIRKYDLAGTLLWTREIDFATGNDAGIDLMEDQAGDLLLLADVTYENQTDVYLYSLKGSTGTTLWSEMVAGNPSTDEHALSLEVKLTGDVVVTYREGSTTNSNEYEYTELAYPTDQELFSSSSFYMANSGQLRHTDDSKALEVDYYTFGLYPDMYFYDGGFSTVVSDTISGDTTVTDSVQRVDFDFVGAIGSVSGHLDGYTRTNHMNFYKGNDKYERVGTYDVIAYPGLYNNVNAFFSSNSAGFKMIFVLESGADLSDIVLNVNGASGLKINGTQLDYGTIKGGVSWAPPFSYHWNTIDPTNDHCISYTIVNGQIRFETNCDLQYPYVIQIKAGAGRTSFNSAVNQNIDWSTFYGGNGTEHAHDVTTDSQGNIFVAGFTDSQNFPFGSGISVIPSIGFLNSALLLKFNSDAKIEWTSVLQASTVASAGDEMQFRAVRCYDNLPPNDEEVHVIGTYKGVIGMPDTNGTYFNSNTYQQEAGTVPASSQELFFSTFTNDLGTRLITSPFGGSGKEWVYDMDITPSGLMYFVGATESTGASSSPSPPTNHTFPVYDPSDGSFYQSTNPGPGTKCGFVTAMDLNTYTLAYSSLITKDASSSNTPFEIVFDIDFGSNYATYCGKGVAYGLTGYFDYTNRKFAAQLDQSNSAWPNSEMMISSVSTGSAGFAFVGVGGSGGSVVASGNQYQSALGDAVLVRYDAGSVLWKTRYGTQASQYDAWANGLDVGANSISINSDFPNGGGHLVYNDATATVFLMGSASGIIPVKSVPGFLAESNTSGLSSIGNTREDNYITAFAQMSGYEDHMSWSTMFGSHSYNTGTTADLDRDFAGNVTTYSDGQEEYLVAVSTSMSVNGTLVSNADLYPVAQHPNPQSWFKQNNYASGFTDIVITRFNVTNVNDGILGLDELAKEDKVRLYPNPTDGRTVVRFEENIHHIQVVSIQGATVYEISLDGNQQEYTIDLSSLSSGMYIVRVNDEYAQKLVVH